MAKKIKALASPAPAWVKAIRRKKALQVSLVAVHCESCKTNYYRHPKAVGVVEKCGVCLTEGRLAAGHIEKKKRAIKIKK